MSEKIVSEFERASADEAQIGFMAEFYDFIRHTKKWWMLPMLFLFLLFGLLLMLGQTAAAPFIYTLF